MNDKICGYYLDNEQLKIVLDESKYVLVTAGAGSGKTMTILGKINYLVKYKNIKPEEILCISFTRDSSISLKDKISREFNIDIDIDVYTFHKLSLNILKELNNKFDIAHPNTLLDSIDEFIYKDVQISKIHMKIILKYMGERYKNKNSYLKYINKNKDKVKLLERLILTFISLFKCNNYELKDFCSFKNKIKKNIFTYRKNKNLLILFLNCYIKYKSTLENNNIIDFDDMIIKATECAHLYNKKYKYIIIDEYQDTSFIRFNLVKKILEKNDANLMVVGDDFQSIYKFTGCDIDLFLNFKTYFKDSKIMKIENTYRNSQELISVAGDFIMKNKRQIRKNLKSSKHIKYPIEIYFYKNKYEDFIKLINLIYESNNGEILILGRNNFDIDFLLKKGEFRLENDCIIYIKNKNIKLKYLTGHRSKGLESNNVIILNLTNRLLGFPNKIKSNKILSLVSNSCDTYPFSEERRLFYVALTRTKNKVYLFVDKYNESVFVKELLKNYKKYILIKP